MKRIVLLAALAVTAATLLAAQGGGCGKQAVPLETPTEIVWPPPPEPARIRYVTGFRGSDDVMKTKARAAINAATGESVGAAIIKPYGVFVDAADRLYVTDAGYQKILIFDQTNRSFSMFQGGLQGELVDPYGVSGDAEGNLYVADMADNNVKAYGPAPGYAYRWTAGQAGSFNKPTGLAVAQNTGRLWVADTKNHRLRVLDLQGNFLFDVGGPGPTAGKFNHPTNLAINQANGEVYVVDTMNFRVQVFDPDGAYLRQFGSAGDCFGCFGRPKGIALDVEGHVYVADAHYNLVQVFMPDGQLALIFSHLGSGPGDLELPAGMAFGPKNRLYVADQANRRVVVYEYLPLAE